MNRTIVITGLLILAMTAGIIYWAYGNRTNSNDIAVDPSPTITETADTSPTVTGSEEPGEAAQTRVRLYFSRQGEDDCSRVFPVERTISSTPAIGQAALNELLKGPNQSEVGQDYLTNIPEGVVLKSLIIRNGVATADFNTKMNEVGGSCLVTAIRAQINQTLMQFPTINEVIISVEGEVETALQP